MSATPRSCDSVKFTALSPLVPVLLSYILSFIYLGIYWNNHHMLHVTGRVTGAILWANLHLLFWLSLVPFVTAWMGKNHFAAVPTALYGTVLLMAAIAYLILQRQILRTEGRALSWPRRWVGTLRGRSRRCSTCWPLARRSYSPRLPVACMF